MGLFSRSNEEQIEYSQNLAHFNKKRFEELQSARNEDLTNSILALVKSMEGVSKDAKEVIENKIKELTNKIN